MIFKIDRLLRGDYANPLKIPFQGNIRGVVFANESDYEATRCVNYLSSQNALFVYRIWADDQTGYMVLLRVSVEGQDTNVPSLI